VSEEQLRVLAEKAEAEFMFQYESRAPERVRSMLGIATARIGGGVALSMRHDPSGYWSKALGFGFDEPVSRDVIAQVIGFYQAQHSPGAVIQIAPSLLPPDWDDIRVDYGITPQTYWVKLACAVGALQPRW
jgi:hypothetical protein